MTRALKRKFEILEGLSVTEYLLSDPVMSGDYSNVIISSALESEFSKNMSVEKKEVHSVYLV